MDKKGLQGPNQTNSDQIWSNLAVKKFFTRPNKKLRKCVCWVSFEGSFTKKLSYWTGKSLKNEQFLGYFRVHFLFDRMKKNAWPNLAIQWTNLDLQTFPVHGTPLTFIQNSSNSKKGPFNTQNFWESPMDHQNEEWRLVRYQPKYLQTDNPGCDGVSLKAEVLGVHIVRQSCHLGNHPKNKINV